MMGKSKRQDGRSTEFVKEKAKGGSGNADKGAKKVD